MGRENGYKTRQKAAILQFFKENSNKHVTVNDIANHLHNSGNPVGVATVYRYIDTLLSEGRLRKYIIESSDSAAYEYIGENCKNHFHLKCEICGRLVHMECTHIQNLYEHIKAEHEFTVNTQKTVFFGKCSECLKNLA